MEVAHHSRPALHNLRMKEGGSASHHTRFNPERSDAEAHKWNTKAYTQFYAKIQVGWLIHQKHVFIRTYGLYGGWMHVYNSVPVPV